MDRGQMKRTSYQNGSVVRKKRKLGLDVWVYRYIEDGIKKAKRNGTLDKYPTKAPPPGVRLRSGMKSTSVWPVSGAPIV